MKKANQEIIQKALALRSRTELNTLSRADIDKQLLDPVPEPLTLPPARTQQITPENIADLARVANLRVGYCYKCFNCDEWHLNLAGGYAIAENAVATCDHVIATKMKMRDGFLVVVDHEGNVACGTAILARSAAMDVAIIKIAGARFAPVPLNSDVKQGTASYCFSYPLRQQGYFSAGIVNRFFWNETKGEEASDSMDALRHLRVNFSNDWAPGSSGSPLFDAAGNVIGHVSMIAGLSSGKNKPPLLMLHTGIPALAVQQLARTTATPLEIKRIANLDSPPPKIAGKTGTKDPSIAEQKDPSAAEKKDPIAADTPPADAEDIQQDPKDPKIDGDPKVEEDPKVDENPKVDEDPEDIGS